MTSYTPTIGLEVHAELKTSTKMFCACKNDPDERRPNVNICPICMAHPGTLPVVNEAAVRHVVRIGCAVGGAIADFTEFDRKNYFYPDIPKGYQISQYKYPLVSGGMLSNIALTRVHLEEDTARSTHDKGDHSLVDFNRAGVPLMELVTEPVVKSAEEASAFAKELQLLLRTLGASDANMEKGEMRVEVNISVGKGKARGIKVEIKNLNSFRSVERSIAYEIKRQIDALERGETIWQETRGWDEKKEITFAQREKESSHDYRYFPDPDLPKLKLTELPFVNEKLPELPWERRARYRAFAVADEQISLLVTNAQLGTLFDTVVQGSSEFMSAGTAPKILANYICTDIAGLIEKNGEEGLQHVRSDGLAAMITHLLSDELSSRGAKDALAEVYAHGGDLKEILKKYLQKSDKDELKKIVEKIIKENEKVVAEYRAGKGASLKFLVGQGMKESKGSANPQLLEGILKEVLG